MSEFRRALEVLGVPNLLVRQLRKLSCHGISPPQINDDAGRIIDSEDELKGFRRFCCPCITGCLIGRWGSISVAEFKIRVNRDSTAVFQAIDPQCWDEVAPLNFCNTFVMNAPKCVDNEPACRTPVTCPRLGDPVPTPMAPRPTQPWCGLLSETALASAYGITTELETVLKVRTMRPTPESFALDYGLCESRGWTICNPRCTYGDCAVERDCGDADVVPKQEGFSELSASKQLLFTEGLKPDMNAWAPLALKVMVGEVADATCRPEAKCAPPPSRGCTSTTQPTAGTPSTEGLAPCNCSGAPDSCTIENHMSPSSHPAFCPPAMP